jgi:hypothetical protein
VEFVERTDEAQALQRERRTRQRAHELWEEDVRPDRIPQEFVDAVRMTYPDTGIWTGYTRSEYLARRGTVENEDELVYRHAHRAWVVSHDAADIPEEYLEKAREFIADRDWAEPRFRYRSTRRVSVRHDLTNLEDPIALHFVNARDDAAREVFLSRFGMLTFRLPAKREQASGIDQGDMAFLQHSMHNLMVKAGGEDSMEAINAVNEAFWPSAYQSHIERRSYVVKPILDFPAGSASPRLALKPESLFAFMVLEAAMVAANGARLAACEHCGKFFLTGHLTGRRSSAKYCSDRCRVAAMRKRNTATGG